MKSSFDVIKEAVSLVDVVERYAGQATVGVGGDDSTTLELEDKSCPFCGHNDSFRLDIGKDDPYYKCFSCDVGGDSIKFTQELFGLEKPILAVRRLAKDFGVELPKSTLTPVQQILNTATEYYENLLFTDENKYKSLDGMTPLEYQVKFRGHDPEVLKALRVGWSDGKVCQYLDSLGFDKTLIQQSGLASARGKGDFMPRESFMYSHMVRGLTSHFTFKNANGITFQFTKKHKLNGHMFYGQDSIGPCEEVVVVEGENDLISVIEGGWKGGVIASIGQLTGEQVTWLGETMPGKTLVTCFDTDKAGEKYRDKISALSVSKNVTVEHITLPEKDEETGEGFKDIDEYIRSGKTFADASSDHMVHMKGGVEVKDGITKYDGLSIFEKEGCYYKVSVSQGEPEHKEISDFVVSMKQVLIINERRFRLVCITRSDGVKSGDIIIDSATKVHLKKFKERIAETTDGQFYGSERDMEEMWKHVRLKDGEYLVDMPSEVGRIHMEAWEGSWLFSNVFVDRYGKVHLPDDQGVYWPRGKGPNKRGISAQSITATSITDTSSGGIPRLMPLESEEKYDEAVKFFIDNLIENFGDKTQAITVAGWCMANAFSDPIFDHYKFFPFPFIWGKFGGGKSGILKILLSIYNMEEFGMTTVGSLKSGVGFERKMAYYCSMPMALDEVRADKDTDDNIPNFRKWFNRQGRALGSRDDVEKVSERHVNSTIIFGGEEIIEESALRSRLIPIRLARMNDPVRETVKTYTNFMEAMESGLMSSIGLHWIQLSCETPVKEVFEEIKNIKEELRVLCPTTNTRTIDIYGIIGFFGKYLSLKYYPEYDYIKSLSKLVEEDKSDQDTSDILGTFFDIVDGLIVSKNKEMTREHVFIKGTTLNIWFTSVHRIAKRELIAAANGSTISPQAIRKALSEEEYYLGIKRVDSGRGSKQRHSCIVLDLENAPESVKNVAYASEKLP